MGKTDYARAMVQLRKMQQTLTLAAANLNDALAAAKGSEVGWVRVVLGRNLWEAVHQVDMVMGDVVDLIVDMGNHPMEADDDVPIGS